MSKSSSTIKMQTRSLLDLCAPPDGYTFVRGAWATHDLDMITVSDYLAPALTGSVATERRQRRLEGRTTPEGKSRKLVIFPCSELRMFRSFVPWCHVYPVGGRRQHAKFALLQFESQSGGKTRTRAIVMSANLTGSGVRRNRELLAWEEIGHLTQKQSIAPGLLNAFRALARHSGFEKECDTVLAEMAGAIKAGNCPILRSSVDKPRPLLYELDIRRKAKRIVIVSPPFGSDKDDGPAEIISKYIGPETAIEVYTGANFLQGGRPPKNNGPEFSSSTLVALRKRTSRVQVLAVPELIPDSDAPDELPPMRRKLHAKLVALVDDEGDLNLLFGSANFTWSALAGQNRELMLYAGGNEADLDAVLKDLHAVPCRQSEVRPSQVVEAHWETVEPIPIRAVFVVNSSEFIQNTRLRGVLRLIGEELPVRILYRGEDLLLVTEQALWLSESETNLEVTMADGRTEQIYIHVEAEDSQHWNHVSHEDADVRPDESWQHLLLDLRKKASRATSPDAPIPRLIPGQQADGFYVPLEQRLVTLARYRHRLRIFAESHELEQQLSRYFEGQDEALQVARALISSSCGLPLDKRDRLLVALQEAMPHFTAQGGLTHA